MAHQFAKVCGHGLPLAVHGRCDCPQSVFPASGSSTRLYLETPQAVQKCAIRRIEMGKLMQPAWNIPRKNLALRPTAENVSRPEDKVPKATDFPCQQQPGTQHHSLPFTCSSRKASLERREAKGKPTHPPRKGQAHAPSGSARKRDP